MFRHRLTPADAEAMLNRAPGGVAAHPLAHLLAAAVPGTARGPLAREAAVIAAFRAARDAPASTRPVQHHSKATRLLTAKAAVIGIVVAAGGIATAAGTGAVPNPLAPRPTSRPNDHPGGHPSATGPRPNPSVVPAGSAPPSPTAAGGIPTPPSATSQPAPSITELCRAYMDMSGTDRHQALTTAPYATLVDAAGGRDKVTSFCAGLLGPRSGRTPPGPPATHSPDPHSGGQPGGPPSR